MRALTVSGWTLSVGDDGEPRARDIDLGEKLGLERPRDLRKLVERNRAEVERFGPVEQRATVARYEIRPGVWAEQTADEFWLNEGQALLVATLSRAPRSADVREMLIRVFMEARRGTLAPAAVDAQAIATTAATAALAAVMAALPTMIRGALAEHTADGDGTIGESRARRLVLGPLRAIADHLSGAERKSREWRSAHRAATNDLRDACRLPVRGRWADIATRHLGDITSRLAAMLAAAERASRKQGGLFSN